VSAFTSVVDGKVYGFLVEFQYSGITPVSNNWVAKIDLAGALPAQQIPSPTEPGEIDLTPYITYLPTPQCLIATCVTTDSTDARVTAVSLAYAFSDLCWLRRLWEQRVRRRQSNAEQLPEVSRILDNPVQTQLPGFRNKVPISESADHR
jgi:hypothetical protein